jgi:hypothetical protein
MKKLLAFILLVTIVAGTASAVKSNDNKELTGEWKYEVPTAPYGYSAGVFVFSEKEGNLVGEVKFADDYKIDLKDVTYAEGVLKCGLYVDYNYVTIKAKIEDKSMEGTVDTPEGAMKITATKIK